MTNPVHLEKQCVFVVCCECELSALKISQIAAVNSVDCLIATDSRRHGTTGFVLAVRADFYRRFHYRHSVYTIRVASPAEELVLEPSVGCDCAAYGWFVLMAFSRSADCL